MISLPVVKGGIGWVSIQYSTVPGLDVVPVFPALPPPDQVTTVAPVLGMNIQVIVK